MSEVYESFNQLRNKFLKYWDERPLYLHLLDSEDFSSFENYRGFIGKEGAYVEEADKGGGGGAKNSERFFALFLMHLMEKNKILMKLKFREEVELPIGVEENSNIKKRFDYLLEFSNKKVLVELKKNLDNVEKDLFKFYLLNKFEGVKETYDGVTMIIFEEGFGSKSKKAEESGYITLMDYARNEGWIDDYFYLSIADNLDKWEKEEYNKERFRNVTKSLVKYLERFSELIK